MKNQNEIEKMKNQIKSRIKHNQKNSKDFIVFRPKNHIFNPILTKQNHRMVNMTSIFQLENRIKNQTFLLSIRKDTNLQQSQGLQIQQHLHIQRCKTFKKQKIHQKNIKLAQSTKTNTFRQNSSFRQKSSKSFKNKLVQISQKTTRKNDRNFRRNLISQIQQKKFYDTLRLKKIIHSSNKQNENKQNIHTSIQKISFIPKIAPKIQKIDTNFLFNFSPQLMQQKRKMEEKYRSTGKFKQNHKRINTEIPLFNYINCRQKVIDINSKHIESIADNNYAFKPWQTKQIFQKHNEQIFQL